MKTFVVGKITDDQELASHMAKYARAHRLSTNPIADMVTVMDEKEMIYSAVLGSSIGFIRNLVN